MSSPPVNKKSFNLPFVSGKSFNIIMDGLLAAVTVLFRNKFKLGLSFVVKLSAKFTQTFSLRTIRLVISQVKLKQSVVQTLSLRYIKLGLIVREQLTSFSTFT